VGKIGIADRILLKRTRLTAEEFEEMKRHTVIGDALCGDLRLLRNVRPIVRHHHERYDGSGYPDGLRGDAIPLLAQIMGIVDVYDALTSRRVYRMPLSDEAAYVELEEEAQRGWRRPDLVTAFVQMGRRGGLRTLDATGGGQDPADPAADRADAAAAFSDENGQGSKPVPATVTASGRSASSRSW
jgi:response regulator RpfG family c-di-GMP phosphodiesterase